MDDSLPHPQQPNADSAAPAAGADMALVVLEGLADAVCVLDRDWRITFGNSAFIQHMGLPKADLLGALLWDVVSPLQHELLRSIFIRVRESGTAETFLQNSLIRTGLTIDVRVFPVQDRVAVAFRDVTARIVNQRALATSEAHLRMALDGAAMGDWTWDAETDSMTMSAQTLLLYGLGPESQGMRRAELRQTVIHPDDGLAVRAAAERAHDEGGQYDAEYRIRRGGEWRWMRVMGGPHRVDGRVVGLHGLVQDIDDRKRASERLQAEVEQREKSQMRQQLLIHELNHRVKNILAMVQAMAAQTLSSAVDLEGARASLESRLIALAEAHDVLTRESWDGAELLDIIKGVVAAHEDEPGRRFRIDGPRLRLEPKTAVSMAMALHELTTNAVKYGALSSGQDGWVDIGWTASTTDNRVELRLSWAELGGPPVTPPERIGFGTRLISRSLAAEGGKAEISYPPQGLRCDIVVVLPPPNTEPLSV
jgi:PAS domain S-box-containing protein